MIADIDLDNIEAAAKGKGPLGVFTHPADTLKLVAEVRLLQGLLKVQKAAEEAQQRKKDGTLPIVNVGDELDDIERYVRERMHFREKISASDAMPLITEIRRLQKEWLDLTSVIDYQRAAVAKHHAQKADDRCFLDDDELYDAFGLPVVDRRVGDKAQMLVNCQTFLNNRCEGGGPWKSYKELETENKVQALKIVELRTIIDEMNDAPVRDHRSEYD